MAEGYGNEAAHWRLYVRQVGTCIAGWEVLRGSWRALENELLHVKSSNVQSIHVHRSHVHPLHVHPLHVPPCMCTPSMCTRCMCTDCTYSRFACGRCRGYPHTASVGGMALAGALRPAHLTLVAMPPHAMACALSRCACCRSATAMAAAIARRRENASAKRRSESERRCALHVAVGDECLKRSSG